MSDRDTRTADNGTPCPGTAPPADDASRVAEATVGAASGSDGQGLLERRNQVIRKPPPMTFGAIDVGTNSIHLLMAEISPEGDFRVLGRDKEMVQLGRGGFSKHVLTPRAIADGMATLQRFMKMAALKNIARVRAVATSAVREATNGGDFVEAVRDGLGLDLYVLSTEEEARLIYLAVRHAVDLGEADNLICDIGGGSVELIVGDARRPEVLASAKLGSLRLAELFMHSDPPALDELKAVRRHIERQLGPIIRRIGPRRFARCIGTSGTLENIATLLAYRRGAAEIAHTAQLRIRRAELKELLSDLSSMTRDERLKMPGVDSKRSDALLPASVLLLALMRLLEVNEFEYCDMAMREGIIIEYIARHRAGLLARATWPDPRPRSVNHLGERCGYHRKHAEQVARLALMLFDQLQPLHRLEPAYRDLLRYACLLHDVGYLISHEGHHKHSYYLIRNGGLQGFTNDEIEIIANVARYHRKGRPKKSHYSYQHLPKRCRPAVRTLIAILRVANALDRTHYSVIESLVCSIDAAHVVVRAHTDKDAELELWTARQHARMFERELGRTLRVELAPPKTAPPAAPASPEDAVETGVSGDGDASDDRNPDQDRDRTPAETGRSAHAADHG